jgi:hypothetical protein
MIYYKRNLSKYPTRGIYFVYAYVIIDTDGVQTIEQPHIKL